MSDDPRLGSMLTKGDDGDIVIIGFPHDEGVRRNGGRVGAKGGPAAFRKQLPKMGTVNNPEIGVDLRNLLKISDIGDVGVDCSTLEESHSQLSAQVEKLVRAGKVPFVVGGGNDQSIANACGLLAGHTPGPVGVVNIDAHLDVRPLKDGKLHSGSPFRQLLEHEKFDGHHFVEFAAQGNQCSAEHVNFLKKHHSRVVWMSHIKSNAAEKFKAELDELGRDCSALFVSFDIDAISGADCPGVSCVATYGLSARDALDMCFIAGAHEKVTLMDVSEFNPTVEEHRTARLVANMFYYFALGYGTKKDHR